MKRLILSTVCMLFCATGLWAQTLVDGIYYDLSASAKTASVVSGGGNYSGDIVIPPTVIYNETTYSVTSIGSFAFSGSSGLTSVEIPNSVTSIGKMAFQSCTGLTSMTVEATNPPFCVNK
ncbi:MAG: leucine-rich repeat domain-containing protein [Paludibacteraceae bacterium]|nr:leucine-rich repeat domain-containing protein [Paludibacteraceae bacterium]